MKIEIKTGGVWIKASDELPRSWLFVPVRMSHTKIVICDIETQLEVRPQIIHVIEWLKPFKGYVFTESELFDLMWKYGDCCAQDGSTLSALTKPDEFIKSILNQ